MNCVGTTFESLLGMESLYLRLYKYILSYRSRLKRRFKPRHPSIHPHIYFVLSGTELFIIFTVHVPSSNILR